MIPYGRQEITEEDIAAVVKVLRSDFLTQGPVVPAFEQAVSRYCGARYAVATSNATSALHIACLALGLRSGDWLWTSPNTFLASANCALYCGANVDFVDVDPRTGNISMEALAVKLEWAAVKSRLPKIVVPVHYAGQSCDMRALRALADRYSFAVIEDASHAIGGRYLDKPVGNCQYSHITVFSFHPVKIITTAEGGIALTNDARLADAMNRLRSHGVVRDAADMSTDSEGAWYHEQQDLGFNYRLTDMQAALGLSQLERLDGYVAKRHEIAERYDSAFADLPVVPLRQEPDAYSAYHLYVVHVDMERTKRSRREVFEFLRSAGVGANVHYIPVHTQPFYRRLGFNYGDFPGAERHYARAISLPMFPTLGKEQQERVVAVVAEATR